MVDMKRFFETVIKPWVGGWVTQRFFNRTAYKNARDSVFPKRHVPIVTNDDGYVDPSFYDLAGAVGTADIVDDAVTNAKLANMAQSRIKGRAEGAGTGDPTDLTPSQVAAIIDGEAITWGADHVFNSTAGTAVVILANNRWFGVVSAGGSEIRLLGLNSSNDVYVGAVDNAVGRVIVREDGIDTIIIDGGVTTIVGRDNTIANNADQLELRSERAGVNGSTESLVGGIAFRSNDTSLTDPGIVSARIRAQGTGDHFSNNTRTKLVFNTTPSGSTSPTSEVTFDENGKIEATSGISFGNETLSNYDQGTWSPTITGSGGNPSVTYSVQTGTYTRIGNVVFYDAQVTASAYSGGSGTLRLSLPITAGSSVRGVALLDGINIPGTSAGLVFSSSSGNAYGVVFVTNDNAAAAVLSVTDMGAGDTISVSGHYFV